MSIRGGLVYPAKSSNRVSLSTFTSFLKLLAYLLTRDANDVPQRSMLSVRPTSSDRLLKW